MIARLKGIVDLIGDGWLILDVNASKLCITK